MRDDSYLESEVEAEVSAARWRGRAATAVGALMSLTILAGVVIWSYRLGVRDAAEIPVIRAELGATKARPEEPGGLEVDYQGRAVYGVVTGAGGSESTASGYAEPPARLADEDVAPVTRSPEPAPRPGREEPAAGGDAETSDASTMTAPPPSPPPVHIGNGANGEVVEAPDAETGTQSAAVATEATPESVPTLEEQVESAIQQLTAETEAEAAGEDGASNLAPSVSPPVRPRPAKPATQVAETAVEEPEPVEAASASRIQIQLGAFTSQDIANAQWDQIRARNGDLLAGRGRVVTPVQSGGRQLWRLRAGPFASIEEASALCRGLKARNEQCIVARSRN